jgi:ATP-dependent Clp endopeptidase proteolytic subunit ClpP
MEAAIRFLAPVNNQTADQLFKAIDLKISQGCTKLHVLISSPGGSVFHGLSLYNYLRGIPIEVYTYNFGSVDSIGVVIYCAGKKRFSVPHSRFLIHGVKFNINGSASIDEKQLEEYLKGLQIDQQNIAKVISDNTKKTIEDIEKDMHNRTTLNPDEAKIYGLTHEIKSALVRPDMDMLTIGEPIQGQPLTTGQLTFPKTESVTQPNIQSFTDTFKS